MKAKISLDVMVNSGRIFYGTVVGELPLQQTTQNGEDIHFFDNDDIHSLVLSKYPTLKNKKIKLEINYVHYITD